MRYFVIILVSLLVVSTALADSVTLDGQIDMDDAYCDGNSPQVSRGTETWIYVMCGFSNCTYSGLMKFDLSGISGTIDSVSLKMLRHFPDDDVQIYFYRVTTDWVETEVTYDSASTGADGVDWTTDGGDYINTKIDSLTELGAEAYNEDVYCQRGDGGGLTELIQDWVDGTYDNYGILLRSPLLMVGDTIYIYSSENFDEELWPRPKLYIEYTPDQSESNITRRRKIILESRGVN